MNNNNSINKIEIRKEALKRLKQLTKKEKFEKDILIQNRIYGLIKNMHPASIGMYYPIKNEVSISTLSKKLLQDEYKLYYPRFKESSNAPSGYEMALASKIDDLRPGRFGIPEPEQDAPCELCSGIDLWLVPGLAFSTNGARLGRGGGYYDRMLSLSKGQKVGILYGCQFMTDIPFEPHDVFMDVLIMEKKTVTVKMSRLY